MTIANDRAYISVPIELLPIAEQLLQVHIFTRKLSALCHRIGHSTQGGMQCKALSYAADFEYTKLNNKFETTNYFLTRKESYNSTNVFENILERQLSWDHLIPAMAFKARPFDKVPDWANPGLGYDRRNLAEPASGINTTTVKPEPDDNEETIKEEPAIPANETIIESSDSIIPENATTTTSTTLPLGDMSNRNVDMSQDPENDADSLEVQPEVFPDTFNGTNPFNATVDRLTEEEDTFIHDYSYIQNRVRRSPMKGKQPYNKQDKSITDHNISKRQILTAMIGLLASVGVASIFGGINSAQIDSVKNQVNDLQSRQTLIVHELEVNSKDILVNRNMVRGLEKLTLKLAKFTKAQHFEISGLTLYVLMTAELARIDDSLNQYNQIIAASQKGEFYPGILSQESGIAAFEAIKARAELQGLQPIISVPQQLSQLRTHFDFTPTGIKVIIEVPLCSPQNSFELHRFDALPIELGTKAYMTLVSDFPIVGIGNSDITGQPTFVEMSLNDMAECHKIGKVHLCPNKNIVKRPQAQSCIYSLYRTDFKQAQHACRINLKGKDHDQAISVGPSDFAHYSSGPTTYRYVCQNNSVSQPQQIHGITKIHVPDSCVAETAHFLLHGQNSIYNEVHPRTLTWTFPALSLFANDTTILDIDAALSAYKKSKAIPALDADSVKRFADLNAPFYHDPIPFSAITLASLAVFVLLCALSIVVYRNYQARKNIANLQSPKYRLKELLDDHNNVSLLEQLLSDKRNI